MNTKGCFRIIVLLFTSKWIDIGHGIYLRPHLKILFSGIIWWTGKLVAIFTTPIKSQTDHKQSIHSRFYFWSIIIICHYLFFCWHRHHWLRDCHRIFQSHHHHDQSFNRWVELVLWCHLSHFGHGLNIWTFHIDHHDHIMMTSVIEMAPMKMMMKEHRNPSLRMVSGKKMSMSESCRDAT